MPARAKIHPVRIVVGFPPGGAADIVARLMAQWLSDRLGQQFIVENRTGAATNVATEAVINSTADGYTLLLATSANSINARFYQNLNFSFLRDLAPIASTLDALRKTAQRVRITGQLVDSVTGAHLWADRFDGALDDVLDLQDHLTATVVSALAPKA
jgi:hypothetical protein